MLSTALKSDCLVCSNLAMVLRKIREFYCNCLSVARKKLSDSEPKYFNLNFINALSPKRTDISRQ